MLLGGGIDGFFFWPVTTRPGDTDKKTYDDDDELCDSYFAFSERTHTYHVVSTDGECISTTFEKLQ